MEPSSKRKSRQNLAGLTLIEIAVAIGIMAVVSLGSAHAVSMFTEVQNSNRLHQVQQQVAMNLIDNLRHDLRYASRPNAVTNAFSITGPNSTVLTIPVSFDPNIGTYSVVYTFTGGSVTRTMTVGGAPTVTNYNAIPGLPVAINCGGGGNCFQVSSVDINGNPRGIRLNQLQVAEAVPDVNNVITANFGPAAYNVQNVTFDMLGNILFF